MTLFIASVLTVLIVSFFCSLSEATLLSIDNVKLETDKSKGLKYAIILSALKSNINRPIAAILVLNTIANTGGATFAGSEFSHIFGNEWMWLYSTVFTIVVLFGTEILPKIFGVTYSDSMAKILTGPLALILKILAPIVVVTEWFSKRITGSKRIDAKYSIDDLQTLTRVAHLDNVIDKQQQRIIMQTSILKKRNVEEIMLAMNKVVCIPEDIQPDEYFNIARKYLHTRYPVSSAGSVGTLVGYLNLKEIALQKDEIAREGLARYMRPLLFVKKSMSLTALLKEFSTRKNHLAIVTDEHDQNIGMITLEDVVEEVVGEIQDEFDKE